MGLECRGAARLVEGGANVYGLRTMARMNPLGLFVLHGKVAVPVETIEEWARAFDTKKRIVAQDRIGGCFISTVFLGIDHQYGDGPPLIFETMIFRGGDGDETMRCESWEQAERQHKDAVAMVRREIKEKVNK